MDRIKRIRKQTSLKRIGPRAWKIAAERLLIAVLNK